MKLNELPNIGKNLAEKLEEIGIDTAEQLCVTGSKKAFVKIRTELDDGCINMLYALEGAVQGIRWHTLSKEDKMVLNKFYNSLELG